jgi:hypothetical protein
MSKDVEALLSESRAEIRELAETFHTAITELGCTSYVKTIYIGYQLGDQMVAALYPRGGSIEVAFALAEDHADMRLVDATHLTWPTLPLSASVSLLEELPWLIAHAAEAVARVNGNLHGVRRPNEHFQGRKGRGT